MINWKARFRNWTWVVSFISQLLIVVEMVFVGLKMAGITDFQLTAAIKDYVLMVANAIFVLLSMLGIVQDPTTKGYADSERALEYDEPN